MTGSGVLALALAACAPLDDAAGPGAPAAERPAAALPPAAGPLPSGGSIATMSDQYAHPRLGPTAAAGASSWVAPAPPPAFVISTPLPPAEAPAPPAALANRPSPPAAPAAAAPAPAPAASPADLAQGRRLFADFGCGGCHILADAGGSGAVGPSLDGNPRLTHDYLAGAIAEGRGAMPAFRGQMSADEIAVLADYIVQVARR